MKGEKNITPSYSRDTCSIPNLKQRFSVQVDLTNYKGKGMHIDYWAKSNY